MDDTKYQQWCVFFTGVPTIQDDLWVFTQSVSFSAQPVQCSLDSTFFRFAALKQRRPFKPWKRDWQRPLVVSSSFGSKSTTAPSTPAPLILHISIGPPEPLPGVWYHVASLTALDFQGAVLFVQRVSAQVHHAGSRGGDPESKIKTYIYIYISESYTDMCIWQNSVLLLIPCTWLCAAERSSFNRHLKQQLSPSEPWWKVKNSRPEAWTNSGLTSFIHI